MESILELDPAEIKAIKKLLKSQDEEGQPLHATFLSYAPLLFEGSFQMLLSTGAKTENI